MKKKVFIIAEAGDNHNGSLELAFKLVDKAKESGADCVKFQTFVTEEVISKKAEKADYQKTATGAQESQYDMVKKLELSFDDFRKLQRYCVEKDIVFLSTAFDLVSIDFLKSIGISTWKIPSGEITNLPYLIKIAKMHEDIILSTGMCNLDEIKTAVNILKENGAGNITLLHCNTDYPTLFSDANLKAIQTLSETFGLEVGYSDHTLGIEAAIAAVALGAQVIEKHFTLDKHMEGPDHQASLEPEELKALVSAIRNVEIAMGNGVKVPTISESGNLAVVRKSIVARKSIKEGEMLDEDNLAIKRPGTGLTPMMWNEVCGTLAIRDFEEDELIEI